MLLKIYLAISIITFAISVVGNIGLAHKFRNKYSKEDYAKAYQTNTWSVIYSWLRSLLVCFIPIFNIILLLTILFGADEIEKRAFKKVEDELKRS